MDRTLLALALLPALTLFGCPSTDEPKETGEETGETDEETSAESDSEETDSGETEETAEETTYSGFTGTSSVYTELDGAVICDVSANLTGTPYTGDCDGCTFAFDIQATITKDNSTEDCFPYTQYSMIPSGSFDTPSMWFWEDYYGYANVLITYYGYGATYPGPYGALWGYDGSYYYAGRASLTGTKFSAYLDTASYSLAYFEYCDTYVNGTDRLPQASTAWGTSSLDCEGLVADVWTVETAGGTLGFAVDTVSAETALDTRMIIRDSDGCALGYSDDAWGCTYPPPKYSCPTVELEKLAAGTYEVIVMSYGTCAGSTGEYSLLVDGAKNVTLTTDDTSVYAITNISIDLEGMLTK